jgi:hypothetical protein
LISEINEINDKLDKEAAEFYDGGYSFEDCNKSLIDELVVLQDELKVVLNQIK